MYRFVLAALLIFPVLMASSCSRKNNCDNVICTEVLASVMVQVTDASGNPLGLDEAYTIRTKTGEKITLGQNMSDGRYNVLDDTYQPRIANNTETFQFVGVKNGNKVVEENYSIGADCCHVKKISGKDKIVVK